VTIAVVAPYIELEEFLVDLGRDRDRVERGVVHVSKVGRPGGPDGSLTAVLVHAGYLRGAALSARTVRQLPMVEPGGRRSA